MDQSDRTRNQQLGADRNGLDQSGAQDGDIDALDENTSVLGQDDDDTGGLTTAGSGSALPGYGDQGQAGQGRSDDGEDVSELDLDGSPRRARPSEQVLETGMGHFGGAGASGGTGPDVGRSGPDL